MITLDRVSFAMAGEIGKNEYKNWLCLETSVGAVCVVVSRGDRCGVIGQVIHSLAFLS